MATTHGSVNTRPSLLGLPTPPAGPAGDLDAGVAQPAPRSPAAPASSFLPQAPGPASETALSPCSGGPAPAPDRGDTGPAAPPHVPAQAGTAAGPAISPREAVIDWARLGRLVQAARAAAGIGRNAFAGRAGVHVSNVATVEDGGPVSAQAFMRICIALGRDPSFFATTVSGCWRGHGVRHA